MIAYLDTSAWIAWKFSQRGKEVLANFSFEENTFISHPLLVAEYVAFLRRHTLFESTRFEDELRFLRWIYPVTPIIEELARASIHSFLKGADLFHLAVAAWFAEGRAQELLFLTCDKAQRSAAQKLGFRV